nr:MAG TPA: hypothetical protein [Caudoviricetes sp.]
MHNEKSQSKDSFESVKNLRSRTTSRSLVNTVTTPYRERLTNDHSFRSS